MARIKIDGDASGATAAVKEYQQKVRAVKDELNDVDRQSKNLERQVKKQWRESLPPLEQYNMKAKELRRLVDQNRITNEQYNASLADTRRRLGLVEDSGKKAFGATAISNLKNFALQAASVTTAIAAITEAYRELAAEQDAGAQRLEDAQETIGQLTTVAQGDTAAARKQDFERLKGIANQLQGMGVRTGMESARMAFSLRSAGQDEQARFIGRAVVAGVIPEPERTVAAAARFQENLGGDFVRNLTAALGAAGKTPDRTDQILRAAIKPAQLAASLGISRNEALAATGFFARTAPSPEEGGTQFRALLKQIQERQGTRFDITGGTFQDMAVRLKEQVEAGVPLEDLVGKDIEGKTAAMAVVQRFGLLGEILGDVDTALEQDRLRESVVMAEQDPLVGAIIETRRARGRREVARQNEFLQRMQRTEAVEEQQGRVRDRGAGPFEQWFIGQLGNYIATAGGNEAAIGYASTVAEYLVPGTPFGQSDLATENIVRSLNGIQRAANSTRDNTRRAPNVPKPEN